MAGERLDRPELSSQLIEAVKRIDRGESTIEEEFGPIQTWEEIAERMGVTPDKLEQIIPELGSNEA